MMAFGKKCPVCGGKSLIDRSPDSWFTALPAVRSCACADCRQQIVRLSGLAAIGVEQRQSLRKLVPPFFLARIPATNQYVRIKNISEGGLCLVQHPKAPPIPHRLLQMDLFNYSNNTSLEHISAEIITTTEQTVESCGFRIPVHSNCARFVNLNQAQRKVLSFCMGQYGV